MENRDSFASNFGKNPVRKGKRGKGFARFTRFEKMLVKGENISLSSLICSLIKPRLISVRFSVSFNKCTVTNFKRRQFHSWTPRFVFGISQYDTVFLFFRFEYAIWFVRFLISFAFECSRIGWKKDIKFQNDHQFLYF